jgi:PAS domain S-box-containing protein
MDRRLLTPGAWWPYVVSGLFLLGLFLISRYSNLLFYTLAGFFSVFIASGVFAIAWNARGFQENNYLLFLGITYLFVGALDLLYTLSYQGLLIFSGFSPQATAQLWLAARTFECFSLFLAPQFIGRRLKPYAVLAAYFLAVTVTMLIIFLVRRPVPLEITASASVLIALKKTAKYVNAVLLLGAMVLLWRRREEFDPGVVRLLLGAIALALGSEIILTFIAGSSTQAGLAGHLLKIASLYLIYRALIAAELVKPYQRLSHSLKVSGDLIRHEKDFVDRLLEMAQEIVLILDAEGRILRLNHRCEALTGYVLADVQNRRFWEIFPAPEEAREVQAAFFDLIAGDFSQSWEIDWVAKDGSRRLIAWSNTAFPRENGSVEYVIGTGIDISEQREVKKRLQQLNGKLEQQMEVQKPPGPPLQLPAPGAEAENVTTLALVSNDFRGPVRWLKAYCRALEEHSAAGLDAKSRTYLKRMQGVLGQMGELIEALLQHTRLAQAEIKRQEVNLSEQAWLIAADLQHRAPARQVEFVIGKGLTANGDPTMLHVALKNLLNQAWKFTGDLVCGRIEFGALPTGNRDQIFFIRDNRTAFGINYVNKHFRSFKQWHTVRDFSGSEVSLATVRSIILRHGGRIWAESEIGQGLTFFFTLPRSSSS